MRMLNRSVVLSSACAAYVQTPVDIWHGPLKSATLPAICIESTVPSMEMPLA